MKNDITISKSILDYFENYTFLFCYINYIIQIANELARNGSFIKIKTMKQILLACLLTFSCARPNYDTFNCAEIVNPQPIRHSKHLIVVSSPNCGYCSRALNAILEDSLTKTVDVTFVEFLRQDNDYSRFRDIEVRRGDLNCNPRFKDFFPVFYLYDRESKKLIYKQKGYPKDTVQRIRQKLVD